MDTVSCFNNVRFLFPVLAHSDSNLLHEQSSKQSSVLAFGLAKIGLALVILPNFLSLELALCWVGFGGFGLLLLDLMVVNSS